MIMLTTMSKIHKKLLLALMFSNLIGSSLSVTRRLIGLTLLLKRRLFSQIPLLSHYFWISSVFRYDYLSGQWISNMNVFFLAIMRNSSSDHRIVIKMMSFSVKIGHWATNALRTCFHISCIQQGYLG